MDKINESIQKCHDGSTIFSIANFSGNYTIPRIPDHVTHVHISYVDDIKFTNLPNGLISFRCSNTFVTQLPTMPNNLQYCTITLNPMLTEYPDLPAGLQSLSCYANQRIKYVNSISQNIESLCIGYDIVSNVQLKQFTKLVTLELLCDRDEIVDIQMIPSSVNMMWLTGSYANYRSAHHSIMRVKEFISDYDLNRTLLVKQWSCDTISHWWCKRQKKCLIKLLYQIETLPLEIIQIIAGYRC